MLRKIAFICLLLFFAPVTTLAANSACNPLKTKPAKSDTSLATTFSIKPDIVAVGQLMTFQVKDEGTNNTSIKIDIPEGTELVDYSPKTIGGTAIKSTSQSVDWNLAGSKIPLDTYSLTLKPTKWTKSVWKEVSYSASSDLGTGYGSNSYFAYYDKITLEITLDERNQAPQTTKDVIRKVTVKGVPEVQITLKTDKGYVGPTISENSGLEITEQANADGEMTAFLATKEGEKVKLTAFSSDSCQDSTVSQSFSIARSDAARTYVDNSWIWWLAGGGLIILLSIVTLIIYFKKKKAQQTKTAELTEDINKIEQSLK